MEIKVGEYIRTKKGNIGKVLDITTCTGQKRKKYLIKWNIVKAYYITGTTIVKHSPKIIDLIEVGDYVNGYNVLDIAQAPKKALYLEDIRQNSALLPIEDIKTIITKEQLEEMEYKV